MSSFNSTTNQTAYKFVNLNKDAGVSLISDAVAAGANKRFAENSLGGKICHCFNGSSSVHMFSFVRATLHLASGYSDTH